MNKHHLTRLCPLLLFALLAVFLLNTLTIGAQLYRSMNEREAVSRVFRTASQYLNVRLSEAEQITVGEFQSLPALILPEEDYITRIYCHDGYLRELYSVRGSEMDPEAGEKLLSLDEFTLTKEDGLYIFTLTYRGKTVHLYRHLSGEDPS